MKHLHTKQNLWRVLFSGALVFVALLATARPTLVVDAQSSSCGSAGTDFKIAREYLAGRLATTMTSGDFNQDNVLDFAVAHSNDAGGTRLSILLGDGQGAFAKLSDAPFQGQVRDLLTGDFNGDGKLDLVAAGVTINSPTAPPGVSYTGVAVWLGRGDGLFQTARTYETGRDAVALTSADFNSDGKADVAVADRSAGNLFILFSKGDGTFETPVLYKSGTTILPLPVAIVAADFNQDNKPDVVVANQNERGLSVFLNNGVGGFGTPRNVAVRDCYALLVGDFSGDGQPDLAVSGSSVLTFLRGDGAGGFAAPTDVFLSGNYISNMVPQALLKADFNGDGKLDLAFAGGFGLTLLLADGMGGYTTQTYAVGRPVAGIALGDFNRDGKPDLAATKSESNSVTVLLNASATEFRGMKVVRFSTSVQGLNVADLNNDAKPDLIVHDVAELYVGNGNGAGEFSNLKTFRGYRITTPMVTSVAADFTGDGNADLAVLNRDSVSLTTGVVTLLPDLGVTATDTAAYLNRIRTVKTGMGPADLAAADFNRDGRPDLAVANAGSDDVTILLNDGRGGFVTSATIGVGLEPRSLVSSDFNSDGRPDLIVAARNSAGVFLLLGDGTGGFSVQGIGIGANPRTVFTGDFNRDGKADVLVPHNNSMFISVLLGTGQGSFQPPRVLDVGGRPLTLAVADFTGDGNLDFALTRYIQSGSDTILEDRVWLWAGDGTGNFARVTDWFVPGASHLRAADLNNDGLSDLAIASTPSSGGQTVWLAFNACAPPVPANAAVTVNAASYTGIAAAPEAILSVFGTELSNSTSSALGRPLPTKLGDTEVFVKDSKGVERLAPLFFVSPLQVNYHLPRDTAAGIATITVRNGSVKTSTGTILVLPTAPGLFAANANGTGVAAAKVFRRKFPSNEESIEDVAQFDPVQQRFVPRPITLGSGLFPATDAVYLLLFGTGLRGRTSVENVRVKIGNADVPVEYAGPQPEYTGLDQVNVPISNLRGLGEVDVVVIVDGKPSNAVRVHIQ